MAEWLSDARLEDVQILHVEGFCSFADWLVVASGRSNQHVHAAASGLCWQVDSHSDLLHSSLKTAYKVAIEMFL